MVEHHGLDPERGGQLHQSELLDLAATRPRIAQQDRVRGPGDVVHPAGGGGPETRGQRRPRRENGYRQEREADERPDEGSQSSLPAPSNAVTSSGRTHDHPDDAEPATWGPFRDRPPPSGDAEREASRSEHDVHAVANQEAEQRDSEQDDRDEREQGEGSRSSRGGATGVSHVVRRPAPACTSRILSCSPSPDRWSLRCRSCVVMTVHHALVSYLAAL